jgi:hypothetical protein
MERLHAWLALPLIFPSIGVPEVPLKKYRS